MTGSGSDGTAADVRSIVLRHEGRDRTYLLRLPAHHPAGPMPLVVELHGRGIDPGAFDRMTGFGTLADEVGVALVLPVAIDEVWNDGRLPAAGHPRPDDVDYLRAVVEDACRQVPVETRRAYVVGMSNGATMAARFLGGHAEMVAAVAQVAGSVAAVVAAGWQPSRPVPLLQVHGTADPYAPYAAGSGRSMRARLLLRGRYGPSLAVDDWARLVVAGNGADEDPEISLLPPDTTVRQWRGPTDASDIVFYRIDGAGHTWPGSPHPLPDMLFGRTSRTFDATRAIWDFFATHTRPA